MKRLAIMPRPRVGDWLEDEIKAWKQDGIKTAVSLLTSEEIINGFPSLLRAKNTN